MLTAAACPPVGNPVKYPYRSFAGPTRPLPGVLGAVVDSDLSCLPPFTMTLAMVSSLGCPKIGPVVLTM
jgi:hypothetical protein